jgi:demethylmenaquinone methyltransferase/2-methoxy-6-polyprenyl-1,4-benzoquinol methylase
MFEGVAVRLATLFRSERFSVSKPWAGDRSRYVVEMFGAIAGHYDLMNWVMTLGQDQRWRRQAAEVAQLHGGQHALDVATGTGDLAFELAKDVAPTGHVIGVDVAEPMLAVARKKSAGKGLPVAFELGNTLEISYPDNHFDAVTCAFGLRNVDDRSRALLEMTRVAAPGARVVILELTPPTNPLARKYMHEVVPRLGAMIARARQAYTYLPESVQEFPRAEALGRMMQEAGLRQVTYRLLNFGTVALHWGTKAGGQRELS